MSDETTGLGEAEKLPGIADIGAFFEQLDSADPDIAGPADRNMEAPAGTVAAPTGTSWSDLAKPDAPPPAPEAPRKLVLDYKGQKREMTEAEVVALAQKGFAFEQNQARLNGDAEGTAEYLAFKKWLNDHPAAGDAVQRLMDHVEKTGTVPTIDIERPAATVEPSVKNLEERLRAIEARERKMQEAEASRRLGDEIAQAIVSDPVLSRVSKFSNEQLGRDVALDALLDAVASDPSRSVADHAKAVATRYRPQAQPNGAPAQAVGSPPASGWMDKKADDARRFSHEPPSGSLPGSAVAPAAPSYTTKQWNDGTMVKDTINWLRDSFKEN